MNYQKSLKKVKEEVKKENNKRIILKERHYIVISTEGQYEHFYITEKEFKEMIEANDRFQIGDKIYLIEKKYEVKLKIEESIDY